jgi:hypothetical protein
MYDSNLPEAPVYSAAEVAALLGDFGTCWQVEHVHRVSGWMFAARRRPVRPGSPVIYRACPATMRQALEAAESGEDVR